MRILVINSDCIQVNSSANLCHLAYLDGLVRAGHSVDLLSADSPDYKKDLQMAIPPEVHCYSYDGISLYEKLSSLKTSMKTGSDAELQSTGIQPKTTLRGKIISKGKRFALSMYGPHGIYYSFVRKAGKFRTKERYDLVISLSTPPSSHLLAHRLLRSGAVKSEHWIQIWEDPWYSDAYGFNRRTSVRREEKKLLSFAKRICYVSPITLKNQKSLFPESADKMYWQPLPAYYSEPDSYELVSSRSFGYFGDYNTAARNLEPFYQAALKTGIEVNICGKSDLKLSSTEKIHIFPRLPLTDLKPIEKRTGVLVYLCNRTGGQIPGKIYQYAATSKTILFILDGTEEEKQILRGFFEPFQRFVFCENTVEDITCAIEKIQKSEMGDVINRPLTEFEPVRIVQRVLDEGMQ